MTTPATPRSPDLLPASSTNAAKEANAYVLGTDPVELERLGFQHRLWSDAAHGLWRRAKIGPGQRVLDIGCGPGFATVELAQLVTQGLLPGTNAGQVVAVDMSATYLRYLEELARQRSLHNIVTAQGDVQALDRLLPERLGTFDMAWARWVFCFLADPSALIAATHRLLRPGGCFAVHDYFHYSSMTAMPRRSSIDRAVAATMASWRDHGGNAEVAGILPKLFADRGFEVVHVDVHQRLARCDDSMFHWPLTWWRTWGPKLVETGYLTAQENEALQGDLDEMQASPTDYFLPPPVTEILVRKR